MSESSPNGGPPPWYPHREAGLALDIQPKRSAHHKEAGPHNLVAVTGQNTLTIFIRIPGIPSAQLS